MTRAALRTTGLRILALLAIYAVLLPMPINDDNGYWQWMAYNLLHLGKWPYVQSWDHSFPGPLLIHVPVMALLGSSDLAFRTADILLALVFCWILYRLLRKWFSDSTAWLSVLVYALYYTRSGPSVAGEKDVFATLFVFASTSLLVRARHASSQAVRRFRGRNIRLALAGVLFGCAALIKPMYGLFALPLVLFLPDLRKVKALAILAIFAIVPLACSIFLVALRPGGLEAYWTATILFNRDVYVTISRPFPRFLKWLISPKVYAIPMVAGLIALLAGRRFRFQRVPARNIRMIYFTFIAIALFTILIQRKYYSYHFVTLVALLTPFAAHGIESMVDWAASLRFIPRRTAWIALISFLCLLSLPYEDLIREFRHRTPSETLIEVLRATYRTAAYPDTSDAPTLDYFSTPDRKNATLEVASFDPRLRFRLARPIMSRYPTLEALGFRLNRNDPHSFTSYQDRWRQAYIDSLETRRPEYFILSRAPEAEYLKDPYADVLHYLPGFDSVLTANYRLDTVIGTNEIYLLRK